MNNKIVGLGCGLAFVCLMVYILFIYAAYWLIDYYFDFPTLVSVLLAWFGVSLLSGLANGAR